MGYLVSKGSGDENDISKGRLDVIYGAPALLNGCKKGTLSLEDAKVLIDECDQDVNAYLQDTEGNKSLTYLLAYNGGNDKDDVLNYLVSKGSGDANDISKGRSDKLRNKYKKEFPRSTPLVCACEKGRFEDVKLLITGYNDVNGSNGNNNNNMTLKEYVNQVGKSSRGYDYTPLMVAAREEHFQIVKYLIEQCEADPNIANSDGRNALHYAAYYNKKDTKLIEFLLTNMPLTSINKKDRGGNTPLDWAYNYK